MSAKNTFFITTAIDYTNAAPHIGHAYEKVLTDVIARYRRLKGEKVYFLTGVDQHGQKVKQSAETKGISPFEYAASITEKFLELWRVLDVDFDGWAATTDSRHKKVVQQVLQRLFDEGEIYKATYKGFYSVRQEQFLTDKERGPDGNYGPEWGEVNELEETNWYFRLAKHKEWLRDLIQKREDLIIPAFRRSELLNAIDRVEGDLCISRPKERLTWGIEIPFDPAYVTYVWFDALINYISFAGYLSDDASLPEFTELWPANAHVIGKDIMVPAHGIYWPIMLHALGFADDQIPPLLVHGWWNLSGAKISKSAGNSVDPFELASKYTSDGLRYYLVRDIVTGNDSDFNEKRLVQERFNADLANDLGNLVNRTLNMNQRYREGIVRKPATENSDIAAAKTLVEESVAAYKTAFDRYEAHSALESVWKVISHTNKFIDAAAPWKLAKDPAKAEELDSVLYQLAETLRIIAILVSPVIPKAAAKICAQLNLPPEFSLEAANWGKIADGHALGKPEPLFPRIVIEEAN